MEKVVGSIDFKRKIIIQDGEHMYDPKKMSKHPKMIV